jgi:hypothetical protein
MQRDPFNSESYATLFELGGPVTRPDGAQVWKQRPVLRQRPKYACEIIAKMNDGQTPSLFLA